MTLPAASTRALLVRVAGELLEEQGLEAVTLREVGRRAGLSRSAPYRHFDAKEGLLAEVAATDLRALRERVEAAGAGPPDPLRRVERMLAAYLEFAREHPQRYRLMHSPNLNERADPEIEAAAQEAAATFAAAVGAAVAAGELPEVDPLALTGLLVAAAHGAADLDRLGHLTREKWGTDADGVLALLVQGLAAAAPRD